jgi:hypothetical protein
MSYFFMSIVLRTLPVVLSRDLSLNTFCE